MLVVVGSARLTKILQQPRMFRASLDITFRGNVCKSAQIFEQRVGPG